MANVIIQDERRQADIEYVAKKYGIDTNNPAMREAAEVTAVRSREAMEMGRTQRRYCLLYTSNLPGESEKKLSICIIVG